MAQARFDRNLKPGDARAALERIAASKQFKESRFSTPAYDDEPILRTGGELRGSGAIKTTAAQRREREGWSGGFAPASTSKSSPDARQSTPETPRVPARQMGVIRTTASQREASARWSGGFETRPKVYGDEAIPARPTTGASALARSVSDTSSTAALRPTTAKHMAGAVDPVRPTAGVARPTSAVSVVGAARPAGSVRPVSGTGAGASVRPASAAAATPSRPEAPAAPARTSRPYRLIHDLAQRDDLRYAPSSKVFYEQAKLLADFESQADAGVRFQSYFPTYQAMSDQQLNAYLSWRTSVRKGVIAAPTPSFAFVYVYELLMGIGCEPGLPAFEAMRAFWDLWRTSAAEQPRLLDFYLRSWLSDYAVYHGLPVALLEEVRGSASSTKSDAADVYAAVPVLRQAEALALDGEHLEGEMGQSAFDAISRASSFRLTGSKFYKDHPAETVQVTCRVFERMALHCSKRRKVGFVEGLFGSEVRRPHTMFYGAVFYEAQPHRDATYRVSDSESFVCRNNAWRHKLPCTEESRSADLGLMLHAIDHEMRRVWEYPKQVQAYGGPQFMKGFVAKEVAAAHEAYLAAQVPQVKIDRSLLRGIRKAAVKTRESLLVDEERGEEPSVWTGFGTQAAGRSGAPAEVGERAISPATQVPGARASSREESASVATPFAVASFDAHVAASPESAIPNMAVSSAHVSPESVEAPAAVSSAPASPVPAVPAASAPSAPASVAPAPASPVPTAPASAGPAAPTPCGLTAAELTFIRALLAGDAAAAKQAVGTGMLSLMVDSLNEKLFDELGDAAVEFVGEVPQLVEDYRPDIEALL